MGLLRKRGDGTRLTSMVSVVLLVKIARIRQYLQSAKGGVALLEYSSVNSPSKRRQNPDGTRQRSDPLVQLVLPVCLMDPVQRLQRLGQ